MRRISSSGSSARKLRSEGDCVAANRLAVDMPVMMASARLATSTVVHKLHLYRWTAMGILVSLGRQAYRQTKGDDMKKLHLGFYVLAVAMAFSGAPAREASAQAAPAVANVRLAVQPLTNYTTVLIARDKGFFA